MGRGYRRAASSFSRHDCLY